MRVFELAAGAARRMARRRFIVIAATAGCLAVVTPMVLRNAHTRGTHVVDLGMQSMRVECDDSGSLKRVYATAAEPVPRRDRDGFARAIFLATLIARHRFGKFFAQDVSDARLQAAMHQAVSRQGGGGDGLSPVARQRLTDSIVATIGAYSASALREADLTQRGYDKWSRQVWVRVGLTRPRRPGLSPSGPAVPPGGVVTLDVTLKEPLKEQ